MSAIESNKPFDLINYFDSQYILGLQRQKGVCVNELYNTGRCFDYQCLTENYIHEIVALNDDCLIITNNTVSEPKVHTLDPNQAAITATQGDWIVIEIFMSRHWHTAYDSAGTVASTDYSCLVRTHQDGATFKIIPPKNQSYRVVSLFVKPKAIRTTFDISTSYFPRTLQWLTKPEKGSLNSRSIPLSSQIVLAVNDLYCCTLRSDARSTYMRAKSSEIFALIMQRLCDLEESKDPPYTVSLVNIRKAKELHNMLNTEISSPVTLDILSRRMGICKTRLSEAFHYVYGTPLQSYWRNLRLTHAYHLLITAGLSVTEVSETVGYTHISSFTRAFSKKFGFSPRTCHHIPSPNFTTENT